MKRFINATDHSRRGSRVRVLAVVSNFKWQPIDYLTALAERFDLAIASSGEGHEGSIDYATGIGLRSTPLGRIEELGAAEMTRLIAHLVREWKPDAVHLMYYHHEELVPVPLVRSVVDDRTLIVFECRDPITTIRRVGRESQIALLESEALRASDARIFVSRALRIYYEDLHDLKLEATSIHDNRIHIALVGTGGSDARRRSLVWRHYPPAGRHRFYCAFALPRN